jgi:hypothetical protein
LPVEEEQVSEDREVWEKELWKVCQEQIEIFMKSRGMKSFWTIGSRGNMVEIHAVQENSRSEHPRQEFVKSDFTKVITTVDRERNMDCRFGPEEFVDLEIGKEEQVARKSPKARGCEGSWPMVTVHGHIKEES